MNPTIKASVLGYLR